ncbi:uncharacterized protein [Aegilops tauschii subsp. strangulata]|uniref:uncharacterized protein n=1 Tax=Aegilops tauschii subsp. strangulata TaxID=200361 RepID=UPI001E1CA241|nr:uncharacterized protein LOC120976544 [Aegilops tauschii subsp. strangulata]
MGLTRALELGLIMALVLVVKLYINPRNQSIGHNHLISEVTPTSHLKTHLPESQYSRRVSNLEKFLNSVQGDVVGFNLLRELELMGDDLETEEDSEDLHDDQVDSKIGLTHNASIIDDQYETEFPRLPQPKNSTKWRSVQAVKMRSWLAGDKRTIIEKAQQFKELQNLEVPTYHGAQIDPEHSQELDYSVPRVVQGKTVGLCSTNGEIPSETNDDHLWMSPQNMLAFDPWRKLKISEDDGGFLFPKKRDIGDKPVLTSPM